MYLAALIVENLDVNGHLQSVYLGPENQHRYRCAFADEYDDANSGPFHLPDENDQKKFEYQSRQSKKERLSEKQFTNTGGLFHLRRTCVGIPTEREILTYYALCLHKFAVPIAVKLESAAEAWRNAWGPLFTERSCVLRQERRAIVVITMESSGSFLDGGRRVESNVPRSA